jgi:transposase InsO family protein
MAYRFIKENQSRYTITQMSAVFGVSRGAYYHWVRNGVSTSRAQKDKYLVSLIEQIVKKNNYCYGSPRVRIQLRRVYGIWVSRKKVARLMRENHLNARRRRKYIIPTTNSRHKLPVAQNILSRNFQAASGGMKWVSDITYLRTTEGWVFLSIVLDLWDRKILGWALSSDLTTQKTSIPALEMALANRTPREGLIFHSDRGVQYCAQDFREVLRENCPAVRQSMSRKGNCWDNACAESFFKTLKTELETLDEKHSQAQVRQSVFMYIEAYYNRVRLHSALDYLAPDVFNLLNSA